MDTGEFKYDKARFENKFEKIFNLFIKKICLSQKFSSKLTDDNLKISTGIKLIFIEDVYFGRISFVSINPMHSTEKSRY